MIPQRLHCPASSIESSSDIDSELDSSLSSGDLVPLITFSENDMAGINLHGILHEDLKPEPQFALSDIMSPFKLHVEVCTLPLSTARLVFTESNHFSGQAVKATVRR